MDCNVFFFCGIFNNNNPNIFRFPGSPWKTPGTRAADEAQGLHLDLPGSVGISHRKTLGKPWVVYRNHGFYGGFWGDFANMDHFESRFWIISKMSCNCCMMYACIIRCGLVVASQTVLLSIKTSHQSRATAEVHWRSPQPWGTVVVWCWLKSKKWVKIWVNYNKNRLYPPFIDDITTVLQFDSSSFFSPFQDDPRLTNNFLSI